MKIVSSLLATGLLASLLVSCASSTMDSVPTERELNTYAGVVRARYQAEYDELERRRARGAISKADYEFNKNRLDSKVNEEVNDAAWNKHFLAESERKADGVPTPDQPVALTPGSMTGESFYRPSNQNFGQVTGQGGSAGVGSMRAAQEQFGQSQSIRNDAMSAGGSYISQPPPGSVYDDDRRR